MIVSFRPAASWCSRWLPYDLAAVSVNDGPFMSVLPRRGVSLICPPRIPWLSFGIQVCPHIEADIWALLVEQLGDPEHTTAKLLQYIGGRVIPHDYAWHSSELVAAALQMAGLCRTKPAAAWDSTELVNALRGEPRAHPAPSRTTCDTCSYFVSP